MYVRDVHYVRVFKWREKNDNQQLLDNEEKWKEKNVFDTLNYQQKCSL